MWECMVAHRSLIWLCQNMQSSKIVLFQSCKLFFGQTPPKLLEITLHRPFNKDKLEDGTKRHSRQNGFSTLLYRSIYFSLVVHITQWSLHQTLLWDLLSLKFPPKPRRGIAGQFKVTSEPHKEKCTWSRSRLLFNHHQPPVLEDHYQ